MPVVLLYTCLLCIYVPPFSLVDPVAAADAVVIDYVTNDSSFLSEQPGKHPFDHPDLAHSILSCLHYILLLYLIAPILMHSLLL